MAATGKASKDFYKVLNVSKTATQVEIKSAYRKLALALHPDRHNGDEAKTLAFKEASEAYDTLSDHHKRTAYDSSNSGGAAAALHRCRPPPPNYRKVYSPRAPPGFKAFDKEKHYEMHYGTGQMEEEVARARKRAKEAGNRFEYVSPLGEGFQFTSVHDKNPYSKRSPQGPLASTPTFRVDYEEAHYYDLNSTDMNNAKRVVNMREQVRERMHERRKNRIRKQKEDRQQRRPQSHPMQARQESGCVVM